MLLEVRALDGSQGIVVSKSPVLLTRQVLVTVPKKMVSDLKGWHCNPSDKSVINSNLFAHVDLSSTTISHELSHVAMRLRLIHSLQNYRR